MYRSIAYIGELVAILRTSLGRSRWESQCEAGYQPGVGYPIHPPGCDEQLVFFIKRCFNQGFQGLNYVCPEKMTSIAPCSHWISPELRRSAECRRVAVHQVCWGRSIVKWLAIVPEPMATWQFFGFAWWLSYGTNFWLGSQWAAVGCLGWHSKKEANNMHLWNRMAAVSLHLIMIAEHMYIYIPCFIYHHQPRACAAGCKCHFAAKTVRRSLDQKKVWGSCTLSWNNPAKTDENQDPMWNIFIIYSISYMYTCI